MNRKAIWAIIGLMVTALLGISILQTYWIYNAIELTRQQFDNNVNVAIKQVALKLQENEIKEIEKLQSKGFWPVKNVDIDAPQKFNSGKIDLTRLNPLQPDKPTVHTRTYQNYRNAQVWKPRSLGKRVDPTELKKLLNQELKSRDINTDYDFQVFATFKDLERILVINNDHYAIDEETTQVTELPEEVDELSKSEYTVPLFEEDIKSPGELVVFFPKKSSYIWGAVLFPLLAAIIFTTIVLFCFYYTVQVIFTQKKLSEMKTDFVNNMTHEFKTPIATISLAVDSITSPMILSKQDKIKRFAGIIKQENKRMLSQVEKVLQMSLLDKKDFKLNLDFIDLHNVINQAVVNSRLQTEKAGGTISTDLLASKYRIEGDVTHISNIIHNLLDNANKYSPENPTISVHTRNVPHGIEIQVKDNGIGLSKEARKNIFDKFYRVHTGNVHDVKGFGLGLAYVKAMMIAHKGQIDVKSEIGKGSTFILTFPFHIRHEV
jgi:two-component system phosphate regulon sensor histidine kinase PhoR